MFTDKDFEIFNINGLDSRMAAIRSNIQPVFQELGDLFLPHLEQQLNTKLYQHIAQHRRRSINPPESTLMGISQQKRGYKMEPHFQLGICADYVFMWLSIIDNPINRSTIADELLQHQDTLRQLPEDFYVSLDHTRTETQPLQNTDLNQALKRLRNVKKGEFQLGRIILRGSHLLDDPSQASRYVLDTYDMLLPIYRAII